MIIAEPVQELSFCVSPSGKVLRCSHHSLSSSLVLWPSPLGKLCQEQVSVRALWAVRILAWALREVQYPLFGSIRVLRQVRDLSFLYSEKYEIWSIRDSVRCEQVLSFSAHSWGVNNLWLLPRTLEAVRSRLVTCLHLCLFSAKTLFLLRDPLVNLERRIPVDLVHLWRLRSDRNSMPTWSWHSIKLIIRFSSIVLSPIALIVPQTKCTSWILSMSLTNFDPRRHSNRPFVTLEPHPDWCK